jgi:putative membrane protein
MTTRRTSLLLGTWLLAGIACAAVAQGSPSPGSRDSVSQGMDQGGNHDAMFMRHAAAASLAEIQAGRIALDKSSSAQVKQLAQRIIDDHTKANEQLTSIAGRKQVTLPTEPMPMQKQEAARLQSLSGNSFDQAYARAMVQDHRDAIKMFGMESHSGMDSDLKQFASMTLPALKQHLQMAEQIAGNGGDASGTPMDSNGSMGMPASGSSTP